LLFWVGLIVMILGGIKVLVHAFDTSMGWGVVCLVLPALLLLFGFTHWDLTKKPMGAMLVGFAVMLVGLGAKP
jgi:hypothetical protein